MSWIDSIIGGLFGTAQQYNQNKFNQQEAEKNRLFQSNEAALQRDWSSQEAERARDWNEEMYDKYNSLSGKISQAEEAGVNPMFALTGNAVSPAPTSSSVPSGASASGSATPSSGLVDIIGGILGMKKVDAEIKEIESRIDKNTAETGKIDKESSWIDRLNSMSLQESEQAISESVARIANLDADTEVKGSQLAEIASAIANTEADTKVKEKQFEFLIVQIAKDSKSIEVMEQQILSMASDIKLDNAQIVKIKNECNALKQAFMHNGKMYDYAESVASFNASMAERKNPDNYGPVENALRQFLNELTSIFSIGVGISK